MLKQVLSALVQTGQSRSQPLPFRFLFHQFFQNIISDRAKSRILQCQFFSFYDHVFISIRKPAAVRRSVFINRTKIIIAEEWAWLCVHYKISIFIYSQVFFNKIRLTQPQNFADPFYVRRFKPRRIIFTTISTCQTIDLGKSFLMQAWQGFQHFILIGPLKELPVLFLVQARFLFPVI